MATLKNKITEKQSPKEIRINLYKALAPIFNSGADAIEMQSFISLANKSVELKKIIAPLTRRDLYAIIYDRLPEKTWGINLADSLNEPVTMDLLYTFLFSQENKLLCEIVFAKTFYERGVDVFVHINKTAGSTLNTLLSDRFEVLSGTHDTVSICSLYNKNSNKKILLSGHRTLQFYSSNLDLMQVRRIFSVIRDPIDLAISFFNFALTMEETNDPYWGDLYKEIVPKWKDQDDLPQAWFERYISSDFFTINVKDIFYKFLGSDDDSPKDTRSVFNNLLRYGVVLLKPDQINTFFGTTNSDTEMRVNESKKYITRNTLNFDTIYVLSKELAHDVDFFSLLSNFKELNTKGVLDFKTINFTQPALENSNESK